MSRRKHPNKRNSSHKAGRQSVSGHLPPSIDDAGIHIRKVHKMLLYILFGAIAGVAGILATVAYSNEHKIAGLWIAFVGIISFEAVFACWYHNWTMDEYYSDKSHGKESEVPQ